MLDSFSTLFLCEKYAFTPFEIVWCRFYSYIVFTMYLDKKKNSTYGGVLSSLYFSLYNFLWKLINHDSAVFQIQLPIVEIVESSWLMEDTIKAGATVTKKITFIMKKLMVTTVWNLQK